MWKIRWKQPRIEIWIAGKGKGAANGKIKSEDSWRKRKDRSEWSNAKFTRRDEIVTRREPEPWEEAKCNNQIILTFCLAAVVLQKIKSQCWSGWKNENYWKLRIYHQKHEGIEYQNLQLKDETTKLIRKKLPKGQLNTIKIQHIRGKSKDLWREEQEARRKNENSGRKTQAKWWRYQAYFAWKGTHWAETNYSYVRTRQVANFTQVKIILDPSAEWNQVA